MIFFSFLLCASLADTVCRKFLEIHQEERERLYEVESPGDWGQRRNVWLGLQLHRPPKKSLGLLLTFPAHIIHWNGGADLMTVCLFINGWNWHFTFIGRDSNLLYCHCTWNTWVRHWWFSTSYRNRAESTNNHHWQDTRRQTGGKESSSEFSWQYHTVLECTQSESLSGHPQRYSVHCMSLRCIWAPSRLLGII